MNSNRWLLASTAVLVGAMVLPGAASAQLLFDWGGQEKVNDSGRKSVRINADAKPGEIIVSFTDRKLYLITAPGRAISYPVAIPREQDRWEGRTRVSQKRENPSWTPTPSMLKENPRLPRWVPGGHPMNPLGNRALYLGSSYYRIHGTDAPWTIGTAVSKGCIRMYNKDALDVYEQTKVGANVLVTWKSYETAPDSDQQVATRQDSPAAAGSGSTSAAQASFSSSAQASVPTAAARAVERPMSEGSSSSGQRQRVAESRYSDIFGTSEPPSVARPARPASGSGEEQPARSQRQTRPRESQAEGKATAAPQREPRRTRETATAPAASKSEATTSPAPVRKKEARQQSAPVETGALPEASPRTKASPAKAAAQPVAAVKAAEPPTPPAPSAADIAAKALAAAERAAAAAERAAAAAERAERAALAKPVAPAAPAAATPAAAPAAAVSTGGSD